MVLTSACPHALAVARIAGDEVVQVADADEGRSILGAEGIDSVVVGLDRTWPEGWQHGRDGLVIPCLRFVPIGEGSYAHERGHGWVSRPSPTEVHVEASGQGEAVGIDHAAQLARIRRLSAWFATDEGRLVAATGNPEVGVVGARMLILAHSVQAELYEWYFSALGAHVSAFCSVRPAQEALWEETFDAVLVHGCYVDNDGPMDLASTLEVVLPRCTPLITLCSCAGIADSIRLSGLANNLDLPVQSMDSLRFAVNMSLLERKAYLHAAGRPSSHIVVGMVSGT